MNREIRVAELIKKEISRIIQVKLRDNRIGFVSITDVEVSRDLTHAKVYVSTFGNDQDRKKAIDGLEHARGFIRKELSQILKLRQVPDLRFIDDKSIEQGVKMITKLKELERERLGQKDREPGTEENQ